MPDLPLRKEKNCLNCGQRVEDRFCSHCGQENVINRPGFDYLFRTFTRTFFKIQSGSWKTITTILKQPGLVIKEFLEGKRMTYVHPIRFYLFASFVTFLLPFLLPKLSIDRGGDKNPLHEIQEFKGFQIGAFKNVRSVERLDSIQVLLPEGRKLSPADYEYYRNALEEWKELAIKTGRDNLRRSDISLSDDSGDFLNFLGEPGKYGYTYNKFYKNMLTVEDFDSIHKSLPRKNRINWIIKPMVRKAVEQNEINIIQPGSLETKFLDGFKRNLPKGLFFFLPVFAFMLWLFHNKKKWKFYDHGIFTLYFFSFILLIIVLHFILSWLIFLPSYFDPGFESLSLILLQLILLLFFVYTFIHFYYAHRMVYGEKKFVSALKSIVLFFISAFLFLSFLTFYSVFTFLIV